MWNLIRTLGCGERIGLDDPVATRRHDRDLEVANRDTWTVAGFGEDGSLLVTGHAGQRAPPAGTYASTSRSRSPSPRS